jgi:hypothetical protein
MSNTLANLIQQRVVEYAPDPYFTLPFSIDSDADLLPREGTSLGIGGTAASPRDVTPSAPPWDALAETSWPVFGSISCCTDDNDGLQWLGDVCPSPQKQPIRRKTRSRAHLTWFPVHVDGAVDAPDPLTKRLSFSLNVGRLLLQKAKVLYATSSVSLQSRLSNLVCVHGVVQHLLKCIPQTVEVWSAAAQARWRLLQARVPRWHQVRECHLEGSLTGLVIFVREPRPARTSQPSIRYLNACAHDIVERWRSLWDDWQAHCYQRRALYFERYWEARALRLEEESVQARQAAQAWRRARERRQRYRRTER